MIINSSLFEFLNSDIHPHFPLILLATFLKGERKKENTYREREKGAYIVDNSPFSTIRGHDSQLSQNNEHLSA